MAAISGAAAATSATIRAAHIKTGAMVAGGIAAGAVLSRVNSIGAADSTDALSASNTRANIAYMPAAMLATPAVKHIIAANKANVPVSQNIAVRAGLAAASVGFVATTLLTNATLFNTMDYGLNKLEHESFASSAHRGMATGGVIGAGVGLAAGTLGAGKMAGKSLPMALAFGAAAMIPGAVAGASVASFVNASRTNAFNPSYTAIGDVARVLHDEQANSSKHITFYERADAAGNADGTADVAEVAAAVAAFDTDGDGHVRVGDEWSALHASVINSKA